jgi:predicted peroxiredoxin
MNQPAALELPTQVRGVALLLWSVSLDRPELAVTPFVLAQACAALEREVELVFTATSVRLLQKCEQATLIGYGPTPQILGQILRQTQDAGVRLLVCNQALQQLGLRHDDLIPCESGSVLQFSARLTDTAWRALVM